MSFFLISYICGHEFEIETDHMWTSLDDVQIEPGAGCQAPECIQELFAICSEIIADRPIEAIGFFDEDRLYADMQRYVEERIREQEDTLVVACVERSGDETTVTGTEIRIAELLRKILCEGLSGYEFNAEICAYVEACLQKYADTGIWQAGKDFDWFSPIGQPPQQPWIIRHDGCLTDFWHGTDDTWQWMSYVGKFSDSFLTWDTGECCCSVPDTEQILNMRPVRENKRKIRLIDN